MKKSIKILIGAVLFLYLCVNLVWSVFIDGWFYKGNQASENIKESKRRGCFVEKLVIVPNMIEIQGAELQIKEIWLERQHDLSFTVSFLPMILEYRKYQNRYNFQININFIQNKFPDEFNGWFF